MTERFWLGSGISLFRLGKASSNPMWLGPTSIKLISWKSLEEAWVNLAGYMPAAKELVALGSGDALLILHKDHGDMSEYIHNQTIIRLDNCKVTRKWFEDISREGFNGEVAVQLNVSLEAEMSFLWGPA
jgi:hypothetical protein